LIHAHPDTKKRSNAQNVEEASFFVVRFWLGVGVAFVVSRAATPDKNKSDQVEDANAEPPPG
jgi:hypothetical protein